MSSGQATLDALTFEEDEETRETPVGDEEEQGELSVPTDDALREDADTDDEEDATGIGEGEDDTVRRRRIYARRTRGKRTPPRPRRRPPRTGATVPVRYAGKCPANATSAITAGNHGRHGYIYETTGRGRDPTG